MAHHVIKGTLAQLTLGLDAENISQHGDNIIISYPEGQAFLFQLNNPTMFEAQFSNADVQTEVESRANSVGTLRSELRSNNALQAAYKSIGRRVVRNNLGNPVGILPAFVICGTNPIASFLGDEDIDDVQEIPGLE